MSYGSWSRSGRGRYLKGVLPRGNVDIARARPLMLSTRVAELSLLAAWFVRLLLFVVVVW